MESVGTDYNITWPKGIDYHPDLWLQKLALKLKTHVAANIGEKWKAATPDGNLYTLAVDDDIIDFQIDATQDETN